MGHVTGPPGDRGGRAARRGAGSCNPVQPFGGLPDFESLIVGYAQFCSAFAKVAYTSVSAIKNYIDTRTRSRV